MESRRQSFKSPNSDRALHKILTQNHLSQLYDKFKNSDLKSLENELKTMLNEIDVDTGVDDDEFNLLFQRIDKNSDGICTWDEFISYLMILFKLSDPNNSNELLNLPIEGIPIRHNSNHTFPINRIRYFSSTDGVSTVKGGIYLTSSKDGTINKWNSDFELLCSYKSTNPFLKANKTWILDFFYLPDVQIICTSSIECDLRFYDTRANGFQLRLNIISLPYAINTMNYWYPTQQQQTTSLPSIPSTESKLMLGDSNGNLVMLYFDTNEKEVFFSQTTNSDFLAITWADFVQGQHPLSSLHLRLFPNVHSTAVTQIEYNATKNSIFSSVQFDFDVNSNVKETTQLPSLVITELGVSKSKTEFHMPRGVTCFSCDDLLIATGGPDCIVRLWNMLITDKAIAIFPGHSAGIISIFIQDKNKRIYSFDKMKIIKVWDVGKEFLLQTYNGIASVNLDRCFLTTFYNDSIRQLIIGGMIVTIVNCCPNLNLELTDGHTHPQTVSIALYNDLFKSIVTCGYDSSIVSWNIEMGERLTCIKNAHTIMQYGTVISLEITSACFNPNNQYLLTAASNGTLKIWDFNAGICLRNLSLDCHKEITAVYWIPTKILCIGFNRKITEFSLYPEQPYGENWVSYHTDDILAGAICNETIATGTYNGEIILWKHDTGQPYRKFLVHEPTASINITANVQSKKVTNTIVNSKLNANIKEYFKKNKNVTSKSNIKFHIREISKVELPNALLTQSEISVSEMIFLKRRKMSFEYGTLVVAMSNGVIQFYSHHNLGTYIDSFNGIHMPGDSIVALATDEKNKFLFTGTAFGYIKTWYIENYCIPINEYTKVNMPKLRMQFPYLIRDTWEGRSKRTTRQIKNPILVNSYKGHIRSLCSLKYIDTYKILLTSSTDCSVRLWTLGGMYIETLGSVVKQHHLLTKLELNYDITYRIPPDIRQSASSTTVKVLTGAYEINSLKMHPQEHKENEQMFANELGKSLEAVNCNIKDGNFLNKSILGKYFSLPSRVYTNALPNIDNHFPFVPVYKHFHIPNVELIEDIIQTNSCDCS